MGIKKLASNIEKYLSWQWLNKLYIYEKNDHDSPPICAEASSLIRFGSPHKTEIIEWSSEEKWKVEGIEICLCI